MPYDKRIQIQKQNLETDKWEDYGKLRHAEVNLSHSNEYANAGAERSEQTMVFKLRYSKALRSIRRNTQIFRIIFDDAIWNIEGYDDYKEQHQEVKLEAVSYARHH